jgi:2-phosphosulfolactate phosphatase
VRCPGASSWPTLPERAGVGGARAAYEATQSIPDAVRRCASGVELVTAGFGDDVEVAVEIDAGTAVPVLIDGAFRRDG